MIHYVCIHLTHSNLMFDYGYFRILISEGISPSSVKISGPKYIRKNKEIDLLCSSNKLPAGLSANFNVNEYTYTKISKIGDNCYSSPNTSFCTEGKCNCTNEGRSYTWKYHHFYNDKTITFKCNMEFGSVGKIGDCLFVDVLGKSILLYLI